ncbi:5-carboxymethyl-2-hydroxymuconate Delta-isomerase [Lutimonas sp.]|uniref:5-carboxymethyl-2-hydroxymuconate Delta-isomerase n=1 Tax=Lutimonas sp. TaxID=1872403 RepID=UPI003D9B98D0
MPHFVIDCSKNVLEVAKPKELMKKVYQTATESELFDPGDIKVRINPFDQYVLGASKNAFIHIFANIMEGRTDLQKQQLSTAIVAELKAMLPDVPIISMNVRDFDKAGYCNKSMLS